MATIRVVLAEDHPNVRAGLRLLLQQHPGIMVVGEASDGAEALAVAEQQRAQVILMDLSMPGVGGLQALKLLQQMSWRPAVIMLTMHSEPEIVQAAMAGGAKGYLLKGGDPAELLQAIHAAARGKTWVAGQLAPCMAASPRTLEGDADDT